MKTPWYQIKAAASGSDWAEVSIMEEISPWYGVDARSFLREFAAIQAPNVRVFINSPGGSVFEAVAMFNGMRASGKNIEVHVLGVAASAASYLAMAGDRVVMPENTFMFLHNPISGVYGNAEDMRDLADVLDKIGTSLKAAYDSRWTGTPEALVEALSAETYFTAAECLANGLCDEVLPAVEAHATFDVDHMPEAVRAAYRKPPPAAPVTPDPVAPAALADPAALGAEDIRQLAEAAGLAEFAAEFALDAAIVASRPAAEAAIAQAREVKALCGLVQAADKAAEFIKARKPLADVRAALLAEMIERDDAAPVNTAAPAKTLHSKAPEAYNPFAVWDRIKANRSKQ